MSFLGSLVPGLREIRAPLVAGYLWLVCGWLLFEPSLPEANDGEIYRRFSDLAAQVGPLTVAAAASIGAYLIGSLIQSVLRVIGRWLGRVVPTSFSTSAQQIFDPRLPEPNTTADVSEILGIADPFRGVVMGRLFVDSTTLNKSIRELMDRELGEAYGRLQRAVHDRRMRSGGGMSCRFEVQANTPMVRLPAPDEPGSGESQSFPIPRFLVGRDLVDQMSLIQTRLVEVAPTTGAQVERLQAEVEFRTALAAPILVLVAIMGIEVSLLWLLAAIVPVALVAQADALSQQANEQLVDGLRARAQTPELETITPVFERYRSTASRLSEALERAT